jgi:hypothetical protein
MNGLKAVGGVEKKKKAAVAGWQGTQVKKASVGGGKGGKPAKKATRATAGSSVPASARFIDGPQKKHKGGKKVRRHPLMLPFICGLLHLLSGFGFK